MADIERLADEFLAGVPRYVWDGESLPVPVEDIADTHVGLLVRDVDDLTAAPGAPALSDGHTLSGLLLPTLGEIWVNAGEAREWPPRRRFTIAHELGHWNLHRHDERSVFCRSSVIESDRAAQRSELPQRGTGKRVRRRSADAGPPGPRAVHPVRRRVLHAVRDIRRLRGGDGASTARRSQAREGPAVSSESARDTATDGRREA